MSVPNKSLIAVDLQNHDRKMFSSRAGPKRKPLVDNCKGGRTRPHRDERRPRATTGASAPRALKLTAQAHSGQHQDHCACSEGVSITSQLGTRSKEAVKQDAAREVPERGPPQGARGVPQGGRPRGSVQSLVQQRGARSACRPESGRERERSHGGGGNRSQRSVSVADGALPTACRSSCRSRIPVPRNRARTPHVARSLTRRSPQGDFDPQSKGDSGANSALPASTLGHLHSSQDEVVSAAGEAKATRAPVANLVGPVGLPPITNLDAKVLDMSLGSAWSAWLSRKREEERSRRELQRKEEAITQQRLAEDRQFERECAEQNYRLWLQNKVEQRRREQLLQLVQLKPHIKTHKYQLHQLL